MFKSLNLKKVRSQNLIYLQLRKVCRKRNIYSLSFIFANIRCRHNIDVMHVEKNIRDSLIEVERH